MERGRLRPCHLLASALLLLAPALPAGAQDAGGQPAGDGPEARFQRLLDEQDARHRREMEELRKVIADLSAEVKQLREASPGKPAQPTQATSATPAPSPAQPPPAPAAQASAASPAKSKKDKFLQKEAIPEGTPLAAGIPIQVYGSFRFITGMNEDKISEVQDATSRIGLRGRVPFGDAPVAAFALAEVGIRLVKRDDSVIFGGDPGAPIGEANGVFNARLGALGFETPYGTVSWGKQYSPYYDIGGYTDQFMAWGGEAQSSFPAGTDGGPSGTGRADQAFQYRSPDHPLKFAFQVQNRDLTSRDRDWGDTLGASLQWDFPSGFSIGAAAVEVRDGVPDPKPEEPKEGGRAQIYGVKYAKGRLYLSATYARFHNHEQDDAGTWFSGEGYELFADYKFGQRWHLYGGFNIQEPDGDYAGRYRMRYADVGFRYEFFKTSSVFVELKPEDSRKADGSRGRGSAIGAGVYFNF